MTNIAGSGPPRRHVRCNQCGAPAVAYTTFGDLCAACIYNTPGIYRGGDQGVFAAVGPDGRWWHVGQNWHPGNPVPEQWGVIVRRAADGVEVRVEVSAFRARPQALLRPGLATAHDVLEVIDRGAVPAVLVAWVHAPIDAEEAAEFCRYATHLCATQLSADPPPMPAKLSATFAVLPGYRGVAWDIANRYAPRWEPLPGEAPDATSELGAEGTDAMDDLRPVLVAGPDPAEGLIGERSTIVVDEHDGFADRYVYSSDGHYRWRFDRRWDNGPSLTWVGLNPGTGDRDGTARPTLGRMVSVSRAAGYSALTVVNLFGWRAASPAALAQVTDPIGADNDIVLAVAASVALTDRTVICWGSGARVPRATFRERVGKATTQLITTPLFCLGTTSGGQPRHPLYVPPPRALRPWPTGTSAPPEGSS